MHKIVFAFLITTILSSSAFAQFTSEDELTFITSGGNTNNKTYVIAEIGINHNGDIELAKKLIAHFDDALKEAVTIKENDYEKLKKEFVDYYLKEAVPRLDHIAKFIV